MHFSNETPLAIKVRLKKFPTKPCFYIIFEPNIKRRMKRRTWPNRKRFEGNLISFTFNKTFFCHNPPF